MARKSSTTTASPTRSSATPRSPPTIRAARIAGGDRGVALERVGEAVVVELFLAIGQAAAIGIRDQRIGRRRRVGVGLEHGGIGVPLAGRLAELLAVLQAVAVGVGVE